MPSFVLPSPGTANQPYQFAMLPAQGSTPSRLFIKNTTAAYVYDGSSITQVTNVNYPTTTVWGCAALDGTVYVMDTKAQVFGCNLMDPFTWTALNFISANSEGDAPVALTRHLNYILAFKERSTEILYDAGNPSPGSPLSKMVNSMMEIGCSSGPSIAFTDNSIYFMGNSYAKGRSIYRMEGFEPKKVSNPFVDRILNQDDLAGVYSFVIKSNGHIFYVLTLTTTKVTLVFDEVTGQWHRWTNLTRGSNVSCTTVTDSTSGITTITSTSHGLSDGDPILLLGQTLPITYVDANTFTVISAVTVPSTTYYNAFAESYFPGAYYTRGSNSDLILTLTGAKVFAFDPSIYQDDGQPINTKARTMIEDWGVMNLKMFRRLELIGDMNATVVYVRYTDDDYKTWSAYRPIPANGNRAQIRAAGAARRRAFETRHFDNSPLRLIALEADIDIGAR